MSRETMQQALDALKDLNEQCRLQGLALPAEIDTAIAALRAALSEPVQQEQPEIRVIPPADAGVQPIAWMHTKIDNTVITHRPMDIERRPDYWIPLYDHPAAPPADYVLVPVEPSDGLLMSMAIRYDHGLGMDCYYDALYGEGEQKKRLDAALRTMRQLHEEVVGKGFYSQERDAEYKAMLSAAKKGGE